MFRIPLLFFSKPLGLGLKKFIEFFFYHIFPDTPSGSSLFQLVIFLSVNYVLYHSLDTECPRRNVPDFGRVFLMLKYTDITQNTSIQS